MKKLKFSSLILIAITIYSCDQKSQGTNAVVEEAKIVEITPTSKEYVINTTESKVTWIGSKPTGKHNGSIPIASGKIALNGMEIVGGNINLDLAGIINEDLFNEVEMQNKLINHLKSADFFDTENHPTASFVITSVVKYNPKEAIKVKEEFDSEYKPASAEEYRVASPTHKITGNLTLRGKTLSVSFPANIIIDTDMIQAKAKFNIDRTLWDLKYRDEAGVVNKAKDKFIYNTVNVGFKITTGSPSI
jgi:hypothetical protein